MTFKGFFLIRYLLLSFFLLSCAIGPVKKELKYNGEPVKSLAPKGLLVTHVTVPKDSFPHDRKSTIIYFENMTTKEQFQYGDTKGPIFMKLPAGNYRVLDFWKPTGCHQSTGMMISNFFHELPESVSKHRRLFDKMPTKEMKFKINQGKMTDLGNLLVTCMEWHEREKFKSTFVDFIRSGKFRQYKLPQDANECGCRLLQKFDGVSQRELKASLKKD